MNTELLQRSLTAYLAIRDALGFRRQPTTALLTDFVQYVRTHNPSGPIRAQLAVDWACSGLGVQWIGLTHGRCPRGTADQSARLSVVSQSLVEDEHNHHF